MSYAKLTLNWYRLTISTFRNPCKFYSQSLRSYADLSSVTHLSTIDVIDIKWINDCVAPIERIWSHFMLRKGFYLFWNRKFLGVGEILRQYAFVPQICRFVDRFRVRSARHITRWCLNRRSLSGNGYIFRETNILFLQYRSFVYSICNALRKCFMGCTHDLFPRYRTVTKNKCFGLTAQINEN